jgi:hypothetical protein
VRQELIRLRHGDSFGTHRIGNFIFGKWYHRTGVVTADCSSESQIVRSNDNVRIKFTYDI